MFSVAIIPGYFVGSARCYRRWIHGMGYAMIN